MLGVIITGYREANAQSRDYRSQVIFIYNFIKYVNWPVNEDHFVIGVVGDSPITEELNRLASIKKTPDGKPITIKAIQDLRTVMICNIIYISDAHSKDLPQIVSIIKADPTLIVAERDGLVKKGAEISFFTQDDDKLGFSISRKKLENKKLMVSGELLRLAELAD